jgi:hypothetical protein
MDLEKLLKTIKEKGELAKQVPEQGAHPQTFTTRFGKIKRAKNDLIELYFQYRNEIQKRALFVVLDGKKGNSDKFAEIAESEFDCFVSDSEEIFQEIVSGVHKAYYKNIVSSPGLFDVLMGSFNEIANRVGIIEYPMVLFDKKYLRNLKTEKDVLDLAKEAFIDKLGGELIGVYAIDKAATQGIKKEYDGNIAPILIKANDKKIVDKLNKDLLSLNRNTFTINLDGEEVNSSLVENKLLEIRNKLK